MFSAHIKPPFNTAATAPVLIPSFNFTPNTKINEEKSLKRAEYSTMEIVEEEDTDHVVHIHPGANESLLSKIEDRISKSSSTLPAERRTIGNYLNFNIPSKWYMPQVVAIGPYHHDKYNDELYMMEDIKWRWFASFMESRTVKLEDCLKKLLPLENKVRERYSNPRFSRNYGTHSVDEFDADELLEMMVVDGFFILTLFFRAKLNLTYLDGAEPSVFGNPLYRLDMVILPKIYEDLLLLHNQIPSFVLETLYTTCFNISSDKSLFVIATNFLCSISAIPEPRNMPTDLPKWLHLLDLVRSVFISCVDSKAISSRAYSKKMQKTYDYRPFGLIPSVMKLCRAGIKVKRHTADSFLDVKFKNGVIRMPDIILDDSMFSLLVNCVAFEQSCNISKHFSIYVTLLDCLVNTARDIDYLCDQGVIGNFIGTDAEVAQFINNLGRGLTIYNDHDDYFFLSDFFEDVDKCYRKGLNWEKWMSFKMEYFGKPWLLISAFVGLVLLVLSFLQTYYTIYAYEHPKN
jgi:hypothetical protein